MTYVQTAAVSSHAALIVSPRASARTPNAAAPSRAMRAQPTTGRTRTGRKLRRRLQMFKFEHRFESLEPTLVRPVLLVVERARSFRAGRSGAAPTPKARRLTERARRHRHWRRDGPGPRRRTRVCAGRVRRRLQLRRDA